MATLESLLERYLGERDERAIEELVQRTKPRLLAAARRIGSPQDAEDCVQTAYLSLMHKRAGEMHAPVFAWLLTAVVRIAYGHKAQRKQQLRLAERLARVPESDVTLAGAMRREESDKLRHRLDQLPAQFRDPIILHYFQGLTTAEVGQLLDLSASAVKKRLERARTLLRARWHPRVHGLWMAVPWFFSDSAAAAATAGGLAMKKTLVAATAALALAGALGTMYVHQQRSAPRSARAAPATVQEAVDDSRGGEPKPEAVERGGDYAGVVVDANGVPVPGARVEVRKVFARDRNREWVSGRDSREAPRSHSETDDGGAFHVEPWFDWKTNCAVEVHVVAEGCARTRARIEKGQRGTIVVKKGARLRVCLRDTDAMPLQDVAVWLCEEKRPGGPLPPRRPHLIESRKTDSEGTAEFHVEPDRYRLRVVTRGFVPFETAAFELAGTEPAARELVLSRGNTVLITIVDENGTLVRRADVELRGDLASGWRTMSDDKGICCIGGIAPPQPNPHGAFSSWSSVMFWHVEAKGYAAAQGWRRLPQQPGEERLKIVMERGVDVQVRAVDTTGNPIEGALVNFTYNRNAANAIRRSFAKPTGADGRLALPRMRRGMQVVHVSKDFPSGSVNETITLRIENRSINQEVVLRARNASVAGVVQLPDGSPATGKVCFLLEKETPTAVLNFPLDEKGAFEFPATPGNGRLHAMVPGFAGQTWPLTVASREKVKDIVARLEERGAIAGTVVDADDKPLEKVSIRLVQTVTVGRVVRPETVAANVSDRQGRFLIRGVAASEHYRIAANRKGWRHDSNWRKVTAGRTDLVVRMKRDDGGLGRKLTVRLTGARPTGRVSGEYRVDGNLHGIDGVAKPDGTMEFRFWYVPGTYDIQFYAAGMMPCTVKGVEILAKGDSAPIDVHFDRGAILRLRVLDESGAPLRKQTVFCHNRTLRTDDRGELELSGFEPGEHRIHVRATGGAFTYATREDVRVPGRLEITLRRHGHVLVLHGSTCGEVRQGARWKLVDADGKVVDGSSYDPGVNRSAKARLSAILRATAGGRFTVVAEVDGIRSEHAVTIVLGTTVPLEIE